MSHYDPLMDSVYMSSEMKNFFKEKLLKIKDSILEKEIALQAQFKEYMTKEPDHIDQGVNQDLFFREQMFQEHERHLLDAVNQALVRIDNGTYGFCEASGRPIGIERLLVVPTTRYSSEEQTLREKFR